MLCQHTKILINETVEFLFWGLCSCVEFNLRNQKTKRECKEISGLVLLLHDPNQYTNLLVLYNLAQFTHSLVPVGPGRPSTFSAQSVGWLDQCVQYRMLLKILIFWINKFFGHSGHFC